MSVPAKKVAAIASAVYTCLGLETQAQHEAQQAQTPAQPRFRVGSVWAMSGRQAMVDRQYHVQFRINR